MTVRQWDSVRWRAGQVFAACLLGGVLGLATLQSPLYSVAVLGMVLAVAAALWQPLVGMAGFLIFRSSVAYEAVPLFNMSIRGLYLSDFILAFLLVWTVVHALAQRGEKRPPAPAVGPILLLNILAWLTASLALTVHGAELDEVVRELRVIAYYFFFFVVAGFVQNRTALTYLIRLLRGLAVMVALASIVQLLAGAALGLNLAWAGGVIGYSEADSSAVQRAILPGTVLVYWMFLTAFSRLMADPPRRGSGTWLMFEAGLLGLSLLLTFTRTIWFSLPFALAVLVLGATKTQRVRLLNTLVGMGLLIAVALLMLIVATRYLGLSGNYGDAVIARITDIGSSGSVTENQSFEYRASETGYALQSIREHPLTGIGVGVPYRPPMNTAEAWTRPLAQRTFVHDAYIWVTLKLGAGGLVVLVWLLAATLWQAWRGWQLASDPFLTAILAGCFAALVGQVLVNVTWEYFFSIYSVPTFATLLAVANAAYHLAAQEKAAVRLSPVARARAGHGAALGEAGRG